MRLSSIYGLLGLIPTILAATSTQGLYDLVKRRLPSRCDDFVFVLDEQATQSNSSELQNDEYSINTTNGSITIQGNTLSALATGLRRYFTDVAHADVYWFIGSRLEDATSPLPKPEETITGKSIVPWRYYFNTGMFSRHFVSPPVFL
jgi:alpha-N-acetylglucosaminidase